MSRGRSESKVYVGNLPPDTRSKDVEELFEKYGRVVNVELKDRMDPPFAFVEFSDPRDAEDAVKARDGYDYDGYRIRVEHPRGGPRPGGRFGGGGGFGGRFPERRFGGGGRGGGRGPPSRHSRYRISVAGLPPSGSWQDLKDHMREAGDVCFTDVFKDGTGIVEFLRYEDMKYALRKLDDTKFRSHEGETSYIRVKESSDSDRDGGRSASPRSRSRSPRGSPNRRRRSPSYGDRRRSPSYGDRESRSRSGSEKRNGNASRSRSRS